MYWLIVRLVLLTYAALQVFTKLLIRFNFLKAYRKKTFREAVSATFKERTCWVIFVLCGWETAAWWGNFPQLFTANFIFRLYATFQNKNYRCTNLYVGFLYCPKQRTYPVLNWKLYISLCGRERSRSFMWTLRLT